MQDGVGRSASGSGRFNSEKEKLCVFYRTKRELKCRSGRVRKIWLPSHFDPRKFQLVARFYTTAGRVLQIQNETQEIAQQPDQVAGVQSGDKYKNKTCCVDRLFKM
jgi:hypothetical protein